MILWLWNLVMFLRVLNKTYLMHCDLLSISGWRGTWMATGGLEKQYKVGQIFYSLFWSMLVLFCTCWQSKNLSLKVAPDHPYSSELLFYAKCKQEARVLFHTFLYNFQFFKCQVTLWAYGNPKSEHFFNLGTDTKITKKFQNAQIWKVQSVKVHWPLISMIKLKWLSWAKPLV